MIEEFVSLLSTISIHEKYFKLRIPSEVTQPYLRCENSFQLKPSESCAAQQQEATWPRHSSSRPHGHDTATVTGHMATTHQQQQATWPQHSNRPHGHDTTAAAGHMATIATLQSPCAQSLKEQCDTEDGDSHLLLSFPHPASLLHSSCFKRR